MTDAREHDPSCEGHIDCPDCARRTCARPAMWSVDGPVVAVLQVVCLGCWRIFDVSETREP